MKPQELKVNNEFFLHYYRASIAAPGILGVTFDPMLAFNKYS